ncbi:hypothetical protein Trco_006232 [Trichoderma cornu-damae]|uniref:Uncharacterized protein n=1 Tax=Trichoderma cornu-damae TaxID=654480 RepID=A0A9P8QGF5_9HYPO|nr:hypothetical protein Trco_006232 [Trichoderma cornu-damae]
MPSNYAFAGSSPSQPNVYRGGRGGAGNIVRASPLSSTSSPVTSTLTPRELPNQRFFSGIGGAGNVHQADQLRPALLRSLEAPGDQNPEISHYGRGGFGNVYRRETSDASSVSSAGSDIGSISEKTKLWASRLGGSLGRK